MLKARVITQDSLPRLVVNGEAVVPHLFFLLAEKKELRRLNREQIRSFAAQGVHLYTTIISLPFIPTDGQRDLSDALDTLRFIIDCDPDAKILPRIGLSPRRAAHKRLSGTHAHELHRRILHNAPGRSEAMAH